MEKERGKKGVRREDTGRKGRNGGRKEAKKKKRMTDKKE